LRCRKYSPKAGTTKLWTLRASRRPGKEEKGRCKKYREVGTLTKYQKDKDKDKGA
jgi:hypothetical protein